MHFLLAKYLLGPPEMMSWDPSLITKLLSKLTVDNMIVQLSSNTFTLSNPKTEKWYGTQYEISDISDDQIKLWNSKKITGKLSLPSKNKYIPANFTLVHKDMEDPSHPILLRNDSSSLVWYSVDLKWKQPKAVYEFAIRSPIVFTSASNQILTDLFCLLISESLASYSYQLREAMSSFGVSRTSTGLSITVYGYSDKLDLVLDSVVGAIKNFTSGNFEKEDADLFEYVKTVALKGVENYESDKPLTHAFKFAHAYLNTQYFLPQEQIDVIKDSTLASLKEFVPKIFAGVKVESLAYGNVARTTAIAMTDKVLGVVMPGPPAAPLDVRQQLIKIKPDAAPVVYQAKAYGDEPNSAAVTLFQVGKSSDLRSFALCSLFAQSVREPFFDQLRTKELLGYQVAASSTIWAHVTMVYFIVQGTKKAANGEEERIEAFIASLGQKDGVIGNMTEAHFGTLRATVKAAYEEKHLSIYEAEAEVWAQISSEQHNFDLTKNLIQELEKISLGDLQDFYNDYVKLGGTNRRKLSAQVFGKNHDIASSVGDAFSSIIIFNDFTKRNKWQKQQATFGKFP